MKLIFQMNNNTEQQSHTDVIDPERSPTFQVSSHADVLSTCTETNEPEYDSHRTVTLPSNMTLLSNVTLPSEVSSQSNITPPSREISPSVSVKALKQYFTTMAKVRPLSAEKSLISPKKPTKVPKSLLPVTQPASQSTVVQSESIVQQDLDANPVAGDIESKSHKKMDISNTIQASYEGSLNSPRQSNIPVAWPLVR